jgi:hypothetical protein
MSIQEIEDSKIQLYSRKNRVFLTFPYNDKVVQSVKSMQKAYWSHKLREWSFDEDSLGDFVGLHDCHMLSQDMIIFKEKHMSISSLSRW